MSTITRKRFLALAGLFLTPIGLSAASHAGKVSTSKRPTLGYISVTQIPAGTFCGDWIVYLNGSKAEHPVVAANDRDGWLEHYARTSNGHLAIEGDHIKTTRVTGDVRLVYIGSHPNYTAFKTLSSQL